MANENSISLEHSKYLQMAKIAKKIPLDDPRTIAYQVAILNGEQLNSHQQFGNNFFILFEELRKKLRNENYSDNSSMYLIYAEQMGDAWQIFLRDNAELVEKLLEAMEAVQVFVKLFNYLSASDFSSDDSTLSEELSLAIDHPLGLTAIAISAWDEINPLLSKAAEEMKKVGINPKVFFG